MKSSTSQLYYTDSGQGEMAVVFLHYFGGSERTWQPIIHEIKTDYRCIAIDLLGFGSSPDPEREINVEDSAATVLELLQQLQLKQFALIGHSMGAKISLAVAGKQPVGLQQLILVAPSPPIPEPMTDDKRKELIETFGSRHLLEKLINNITAHPLPEDVFKSILEDHLRISRNGWNAWLNKGSKENISANMRAINLPINIIHGAADPNFTMDLLKDIFNHYFKKINYIELPNVGHIVPVEVPDKLSAVIKSILA